MIVSQEDLEFDIFDVGVQRGNDTIYVSFISFFTFSKQAKIHMSICHRSKRFCIQNVRMFLLKMDCVNSHSETKDSSLLYTKRKACQYKAVFYRPRLIRLYMESSDNRKQMKNDLDGEASDDTFGWNVSLSLVPPDIEGNYD